GLVEAAVSGVKLCKVDLAEQRVLERNESLNSDEASEGALRGILSACCHGSVAALSVIVSHCKDDEVARQALDLLERLACATGVMEVSSGRDASMAALCYLAAPATGAGEAWSLAPKRKVKVIVSLLCTVHRLGNYLGECWQPCLATLEGLQDAGHGVPEAIERFPSYTQWLSADAMFSAFSALSVMSVETMAQQATRLPDERLPKPQHSSPGLVSSLVGAAARGVGIASASSNTVGVKERMMRSWSGAGTPGIGFPLRLLVQCAGRNITRLGTCWDLVTGHLRVMAKSSEAAWRDFAVKAARDLAVAALTSKETVEASAAADNPKAAIGHDSHPLAWVFKGPATVPQDDSEGAGQGSIVASLTTFTHNQ
ncbi:unnamed protein product, partial [Chrysoparadoxa australica]